MDDSNRNMLKKCNVIDQMAISDLLDGRTFFIPSYQRGYRWTKTQIYDLCNDLLEYALKPNENSEKQKSFYSLQSLIVRKAKRTIASKETEVYEVIDGQQRLTTIYILYKYLMVNKKIMSVEELKKRRDVSLYHIFYETRPDDYGIIENLGFSPILNRQISNIDVAHIANSYNYIGEWMLNSPKTDPKCAKSIWEMFSGEKFTFDAAVDTLFDLLNNAIDSNKPQGKAQFVWYEIDASKDAIQEFLSENKGKIPLTDTEKIRALFMRRKNNNNVGDHLQLSIAKDWELIENTLHRNDFWSFISTDIHKEDGRISLIFQYIYDRDCDNKEYQGDDKLFRYYSNLFNNRSGDVPILTRVTREWNKVMEAFRMLQNWYQNPRVYNLVGLLTKEGANISTKDIADLYDDEDVITTEDFILKLKKKVREVILDPIPIVQGEDRDLEMGEGDKHINLFFDESKDKKKIPGLLRFLNVNALCQQIERLMKDVDKPVDQKRASDMGRSNRDELCAIFRFPFDALDAFGWDIEHIDSATTNSLTNPREQKVWMDEAENALGDTLAADENYAKYKVALQTATDDEEGNLISNMLSIIKGLIEEDDSEKRKNWIGNLTLLDCGTNRMYKNKIFAEKRQIIQERINRGVFVPVCTQNVFNKNFEGCTKNNLKWDFNDKKSYHKFILETIEQFKNNLEN